MYSSSWASPFIITNLDFVESLILKSSLTVYLIKDVSSTAKIRHKSSAKAKAPRNLSEFDSHLNNMRDVLYYYSQVSSADIHYE